MSEKRKVEELEEFEDEKKSFPSDCSEEVDDFDQLNEQTSESESDEEDDSEDENEEGVEQMTVDFEAFPPEEEDFHGIKSLLKQLFQREQVEISDFANYLIQEKDQCLIVKQDIDDNEDDPDVYSLTAIVKLTDPKVYEQEFGKKIIEFLRRTAEENKCDDLLQHLQNSKVCLILNERFINLPSQLGLMSLQTLLTEIEQKSNDITHFVLIAKTLSPVQSKVTKNSKKLKANAEKMFLNNEDELLLKHASSSYEFQVEYDQVDASVHSNWSSGQKFLPFRQVMLFTQQQLKDAVNHLKSELQM